MNYPIQCLIIGVAALSAQAQASLVVDQDFSTCSAHEWLLDTDGFGPPADTRDFSFTNDGTNCSAQITMDNLFQEYLDYGMGYANTLYTDLDLSALAAGESATLSFDFSFAGFDLQDDWSDLFAVTLSNGIDWEQLLTIDDYGTGTFTTSLDNSYDGWSLDFSLNSGYNLESFSSSLSLSNLSLVSNQVPEPASLALFLMAGVLLSHRKKTQQ